MGRDPMDATTRRLSRRTALTLATAGLGGLLLPAGAAAWLRGARQPLPAAHAAAADAAGAHAVAHAAAPPPAPPQPAAVEVALAATTRPVAVPGATLPFSYDGSFPGPVVRLREGDRVRLSFANRLDEVTNLHLHGLHIPPAVDDPFVHIMPGESRLYEFTLPPGSAGTHWYHPHHHGELATQIRGGLVGPLVISGPLDDLPALRAAQEHLLVFTAVDGRGGRGGGTGGVMVNGQPQATLTAASPTLRLRLLNASADTFVRL